MFDKLLPTKKIILPNGKEVTEKPALMPFVVVAILVLTYMSAVITGFNVETIIKRIEQFFCDFTTDGSSDLGVFPSHLATITRYD